MGKVAIIGVGQSTFVRSYPGSIRELAFEGFKDAMQDAQLTTKDIDASVVCSAPEYDKQRSPAGVFAEYLGLNPQPTFYVETLCSSSSTGLKLAYSMVKSGLHDAVAVSYTSGPMAGREIVYGFGEGSGVYVIDVTDKTNMHTIGYTSYPGIAYSHSGALSEDLKYLFVIDIRLTFKR